MNLVDRIAAGSLRAKIVLVIASRSDIAGIAKAEAAGLTVRVVSRKDFASANEHSDSIFSICNVAKVDLICLGGWLQLLCVPDEWLGRVMNIHPSLLPRFGGRGMWGHYVHQAVLAAGCEQSGCTVHFVDNEYDAGPIILQRTCPVLADDTPARLAARVFAEECVAYPQAIEAYQAGKIVARAPRP